MNGALRPPRASHAPATRQPRLVSARSVCSGPNNSPEGLTKGLTHAFTLTFASSAARDAYLPHPVHAEFVETWVKPNITDVCVFDYEIAEPL